MNNKKLASFLLLAVFAVAFLVLASYAGSFLAYPSGKTTEQAFAPEAAVVTVTPEPVVVEKEVRVAEIPAVCFDALDREDEAFAYTGEVFGVVSEVLNAMGDLDLAAMEKGVDKLGGMQEKLGDKLETYKTARDACRANAKG